MKIGIDCRLWNESGVGRYIRNLIKNLIELDHRNEYVLFVRSVDYEDIKYQISNIKNKWKIVNADIRWHTIEEQFRFPSILNKENLDLVHFPYFSVPIFYNKPFVVTIHDLILHHFPTGEASTLPLPIYQLKLAGYKFVISQAAKKAKKIITVSNATKKEIVDHLGVDEDKIVVTYESVDDRLNSKLKTQNSKLQLKAQSYFLYVGNAYPHKNLERLLQAFSLVRQDDIKLVLVGKEDYFYKRLKEKVREMGFSGSIIFYGEAIDDELTNLYQNTKALIMPSLMEGFGLPALEAMANKCLVLCSDIPALKEVCGDAAVYFSPYSIDEMVGVMRDVCFNDSNHLSRNIQKGLRRAKIFSWQKMAKDTLKIYESSAGV